VRGVIAAEHRLASQECDPIRFFPHVVAETAQIRHADAALRRRRTPNRIPRQPSSLHNSPNHRPLAEVGRCQGEADHRSSVMPQFDPRLIDLMRSALEDVMSKVPVECATPAAKAYLAECILKAAAQGHTSYHELITAASDQIQVVLSLFT
jgi:hypothetical protein